MALNKDRVFKAAENYIKKNRIDKAIAEYESWLKENPKDWNIIRTVGDLYARISRNDEAIKKYAQVADHYRKDGFNVRAIATHKMVLRLDPQNEPAMRNLAELQAEEGLLMEAKSYYQTLVELYNKQGHKRLASEVFKKLAEIDPQDVKIRYKYADFLNKNGKPDEAAREYVGIADQFIGQGLVDEAVKILEQGRSLQTSDPALKIKLAQACSMQGNHAQAVRLLEEVRRSAPGDPVVLGRLGEAYLAAGNTDDAQMIFQELGSVQPGNPENILRLADLRIAQSKLDTALEELSPLVDRYVSQSEGKKATELLSKVLSKDPYHIKTLLKLAEIATILKQDSGRVAAYDSLCEAYSRAGDYQKAVQVAERLVEIDPESSQHKDRLKFFKSTLAGPARAPEPAPKSAPAPPPRPAAPPAKPAAAAPPPRVESRPSPAPPPRPAAPAPPPRPAPPPPKSPISEISDIPDFGSFGDDLSQAVEGSFSDLSLDEPKAPAAATASAIDLGDMVELTQEEEENIKEKLTEAEVFVRYGLVDKAIGQLVDVLESFRFHLETREKLIEIYKDQGMNREAGEQLMHVAQVYDRLGRSPEAGRARQEAAQLNPALASRMAEPEVAIEEEPELILATETESDLGDAGIEIDIASMDEERPVFAGMSPPSEAEISISFDDASFDEPEIDVSLDESAGAAAVAAPLSDEAPIEVDWGAAGSDFGGLSEAAESEESIDLTGAVEVGEEEISVSMDDELPEEVEFASTGRREEVRIETEPEEFEINLEVSSAEIPISVEEPVASASVLDDGFEVEIEDEVTAGSSSPAFDEEFSVDLGEEDEPPRAASRPDKPVDEETFSPSFDASGEDGSDFQIDIPSSADVEMDLSDLTNLGLEDEEAIEVEEVPEPPKPSKPSKPVVEPRQAAPPPKPSPPPAQPKAAPRPEPPPAPKAAPAPAPPPTARTAKSPLAAELDEVDEYIALGLYEDARDTLRELLKKHPGQHEILAKIEELGFSSEQIQREAKEPARLLKTPVAGAPEKKPAEAPQPPVRKAPAPQPIASPIVSDALEVEFAEDSLGDELESLVDLSDAEPADFRQAAARPAAETDFIDLASELSEEIFGTHSAVEEEDSEPEGPLTDPGLDQIFREFRKGVEKQLGAEDYDTRYNLGIAYKEMGLLDEAISEFQLAAKDELRSLECCSMLGLCFMEKGMPDIAIKWFSKGLAIPGRREEEYHGLRYDLAQAYEAAGQSERALQLYMEIFRENIKFRDVQERVKELQAARK